MNNMNKVNDKWSALSMKDRAELINIYVKSGITDLGEIRNDYNSFDYGGVKDKIYNVGYDKIIKPTIDELGISEVRKRLYNNITPLSYAQPIKRVYNAIIKDRPYSLIKNPEVETNVNYDRDDIWAEYLQIPESERHKGPTKKVGYSNYTPSKSSFKHSKYRNVELEDEDKKKLLDAAFFGDTFYDSTETVNTKGIKVGESEITNALKKYFGTHTVSRGFDDKGEYISYYDLWDLAPLSILGIDESKGIGKPIEFYDRIYLDDYYNIPEEFRGKPFISPSVVEATRNSFGDGGDTEPLYYDDTYIEPAVVKAFNSTKEYNRYQGRKGAEAVRRGMNKAANTIADGLRYTPVVGDVMDGLEAYEEAKTGNLTKAGVLAGLTLLPNALEKPVKAVGKGLKNLRLYNRYVKDVKRFEEPVQFAIKGMEENYDLLKSNFPEMNTVEDARRTMNTTVSTRFKPLEAIKNKTLGDYAFDNGEIWLNAYAPIRLKQAWKSPKHSIKQLKQVAAHEGTHSALDNLNITLSEKNGNYYRVIPGSAIENSTKHLYNKVGREGTVWQNLPEEFIAEMNAAKYTLGEKPGSSIDSWSTPHANRSENYLSRRFSFEPGETGELIDIYEGFGFDNGGFLHIDPFNLTSPKEDSIIVPYKDVVTSEMNRELIQPTQDKISRFVETMYPIIEQTLVKKGYSTKNINNILRQMAFESDYGLSPRGNGYNLSGIKTWNESEGSRHSDGNLYRNFKDYSDYANFYIDLLNNRYDAINAKDTDDYIYKLHHGKNGEKYSSNEKGYVNVFNNMKSLDAAIKKYLNK